MPFPALSKTTLRQQAGEASFQMGLAYYQQGAVVSLVKRGDHLQAEVEGSEYTPYQVRIGLDAGSLTPAECSCPYEWSGWCKHIVAALLACLEHPDIVEERPPLQEQLAALSREQLQALLLKLAEREPALTERIEAQLVLFQAGTAVSTESPSANASGRRTPIDPKPFRRQVQAAIHSLDRLLRPAQDFIEGGGGSNALRIPAGARALANLYALVETAQANGWDSWTYLTSIFTRLPPATTVSQVEALLPWNLPPGPVSRR